MPNAPSRTPKGWNPGGIPASSPDLTPLSPTHSTPPAHSRALSFTLAGARESTRPPREPAPGPSEPAASAPGHFGPPHGTLPDQARPAPAAAPHPCGDGNRHPGPVAAVT